MEQSDKVLVFRKTFFPEVSDEEWHNWRWQLRNRFRDLASLERVFKLSDDEREGIAQREGMLPPGITPYYAALLDPVDSEQGLRRTKIPSSKEFIQAPGERDDPLGEEDHRPVEAIVHTYPDKVLFLVTDFCATYCRYCTRSRMVGGGEFLPRTSMWEEGLDYIREHPEIRDVLLSGGDPLALSDDRLEWLLSRLAAIPHIEMIRIGTKIPAVLPQRITKELIERIRPYHPIYLSIHFIHPDELTPEVARACNMLADAGFPMGGQSVLLKGVNDTPEIMKQLNQGLLKIRVKPYYLHQCDPVTGSSHFKTSIETGLDIIRSLHGHTTGYAVPMYMVDAPGGGGKIPLAPDFRVGRNGDYIVLKNYRGDEYEYFDP